MLETEHAARLAARREKLREILAGIPDVGRRPFLLELGCGHGHFLAAYAAEHRAELCIGVDMNRERIERAGRKRQRAGADNLHFIRAEAEDFLAALPGAARFSKIYLLFPDPWPKRRHHKNRLLGAEFLAALARRSEANARLFFRTDHEEYFRSVCAAIAGGESWARVEEEWPYEFTTVFHERAERVHSLIAQLGSRTNCSQGR